VGFTLGGFMVYGYLNSLPYCERCARYFSTKGSQTRYTDDPGQLESVTAAVMNDFRGGAPGMAISSHRMFGEPKANRNTNLRSTIEVRQCKQCRRHWLKYGIEKKSGKDWKAIPKVNSVVALTDEVVNI
jgi:hypothetical protein